MQSPKSRPCLRVYTDASLPGFALEISPSSGRGRAERGWASQFLLRGGRNDGISSHLLGEGPAPPPPALGGHENSIPPPTMQEEENRLATTLPFQVASKFKFIQDLNV